MREGRAWDLAIHLYGRLAGPSALAMGNRQAAATESMEERERGQIFLKERREERRKRAIGKLGNTSGGLR